MAETENAGAVRAGMAEALLRDMANFGDPVMRANAEAAYAARGQAPPTGQPAPAPTPSAAPAPAAPTPAAPNFSAPTPAATTAPAPGAEAPRLYAGKFKSIEEFERSYFHAQNSLSRTTDELVQLRNRPAGPDGRPTGPSEQAGYLPGPTPGAAPRINPAAYDSAADIAELVKSSEESGALDPNLLAQTVARIAANTARGIAAEQVDATIRPLQQMADAEAYMRSVYPDSANHVVEVGNFVKADPETYGTVQALLAAGQPKQAMKYAYESYMISQGQTLQRAGEANAQITEEERLAARGAAGLPTPSPSTGVHNAPAGPPNPREFTPDTIAALNEHAKLDQGTLRRRAWLGHMLPPEMRTWEMDPNSPQFQR